MSTRTRERANDFFENGYFIGRPPMSLWVTASGRSFLGRYLSVFGVVSAKYNFSELIDNMAVFLSAL